MPFSYREQAPPEALAQWVECQWRVESAVEIPHYGVAPDGCLDIVFSTSGGLRAIGTMTAERRYHLPGGERMCGVRFRPGMAGAFLKAEAAELTDAEAPLEDLWGAPARRLAERMHEARTTADAAAALAAALRPPTPPDNVQRAVAAIAAAHGAVDVDQLARLAGLSPRQFRRRCREASGLTPKHLCRVLRFRRAVELAAREPGLKWSLVAVDAGYFDQAHLIRDYREFTGRAPASGRIPDGRFVQYRLGQRSVRSDA